MSRWQIRCNAKGRHAAINAAQACTVQLGDRKAGSKSAAQKLQSIPGNNAVWHFEAVGVTRLTQQDIAGKAVWVIDPCVDDFLGGIPRTSKQRSLAALLSHIRRFRRSNESLWCSVCRTRLQYEIMYVCTTESHSGPPQSHGSKVVRTYNGECSCQHVCGKNLGDELVAKDTGCESDVHACRGHARSGSLRRLALHGGWPIKFDVSVLLLDGAMPIRCWC